MIRPTLPLLKPKAKSASSSVWLARQARDPYTRLRFQPSLPGSPSSPASPASPASPLSIFDLDIPEESKGNDAGEFGPTYRSRASFKLLDLNKSYKFLSHVDVGVVVDLGGAPGGWSQVVANTITRSAGSKLRSQGIERTIIAVDLLPMEPIRGVKTIQADFLVPQTSTLIRSFLPAPSPLSGNSCVDVILSDIASNISGNRTRDSAASLDVCEAVFAFASEHLRKAKDVGRKRGGVLVLKHFAHPLLTSFHNSILVPSFHTVAYAKPDSSRKESSEGYWVCMGWKGLGSNANVG